MKFEAFTEIVRTYQEGEAAGLFGIHAVKA